MLKYIHFHVQRYWSQEFESVLPRLCLYLYMVTIIDLHFQKCRENAPIRVTPKPPLCLYVFPNQLILYTERISLSALTVQNVIPEFV